MIERVWGVITRDWSFLALLVSVLGFGIAAVVPMSPVWILILAIVSFAAFDVIGFESIRNVGGDSLIAYRICQSAFQWMISILATSLSGGLLWVGFGYTFLWWVGVCDWLYYPLRREYEYVKYTDMFWLWWTPLGIVNKALGRRTNGVQFTIVSVSALILWFLLWVYVDLSHTLTVRGILGSLFGA